MWATSLFLIITLVPSTHSLRRELGFFPQVYTKWVRAQLTELKCPSSSLPSPKEELLVSHSTIILQSNHHEMLPVTGVVCIGLRYVTHCSEGFFGTKTITKRIEKVVPTIHLCTNSIDEHNQGKYVPPYFLAESCTWMSENEVSKEFFLIEPHAVTFDPYTVGFVDPLLLDDVCTETFCRTEHENTFWFSPIDPIEHCSQYEPEGVLIYTNRTDDKQHWIRFRELFFYSLRGSCEMTYCGKRGLRLSNGMFFGGFTELFYNHYGKCSSNLEIKITTQKTELEMLEEEIQEDRDRLDCLNALNQMRISNQTSYLLLSYMDPHVETKAPVYRLRNGILEKAMAQWVGFVKFHLDYPSGWIGSTRTGKNLLYKWWVESGKPGLLSGYNGVHKIVSKKKIVYPRKDLLEMEYENSLLTQHELVPIEHPHVTHLKKEGINDSLVTLVSHNKVNVGEWIVSAWNTAWGKVTAIITTIVFIVISYFILKLVISCCGKCKTRSGKKSQQSNQSAVEMIPLRTRKTFDPFSP
ncbi:MAG: matrix protein [Alxa tick rhabdovirus]|uniref:Matrix protein n=1 Tax=Alxa tick rhabdovirus TaxID=2977131 RepID=A0A977WM93_9RHAB|nr:MAG: matrix protein [Alxa tick rhabdovirus]